jgi:two-component system, NarL family, invasion response regulator UvrY
MIRAAVVDDHPVFRQGLANAVEGAADFELVCAAASVEALGDVIGTSLDLVILDLGLPGMGGAAAVRHLAQRDVPVLVVSAEVSRRDVIGAMEAGAAGYLTKSVEPEEIIDAARVVAAGGTYVSPTLASFLLRAHEAPTASALTEREREILTLVADGERDGDIAELLHISKKTVQSHLDRIRDKTGRRRRAELTRFAIEEGLGGDKPTDR